MEKRADSPRLYTVAWAFYLLLALAGVAWVGWRGDLSWRLFVDPDGWLRDITAGGAVAAGLLALWGVARRTLAAARVVETHIADLLGDVEGDEIFALSVISAVGEELFFRGGVQGSWGWLWATVLFAAVHTGPGRAFRLWTAFALVAGLAFAALTLWTGNLLAAMVAHGLVNGINLRYARSRRQASAAAPEGDESE